MQKLIDAGYTMWLEKEDGAFSKESYQKSIVRDDIPLCKCNDGVFLNVERFMFPFSQKPKFSIFLSLQNHQDEWCNLEIYGLSENEIENNLDKLEEKLLNMWKVFND